MTEREETIALANRVLDRVNADPDDDLAMLSRQLLRALECNGDLMKACEEKQDIINCDKQLLSDAIRDAVEANRLLAAVRKVRDGYADQARFADHEPAAYFRGFVRRLDAACEVTK